MNSTVPTPKANPSASHLYEPPANANPPAPSSTVSNDQSAPQVTPRAPTDAAAAAAEVEVVVEPAAVTSPSLPQITLTATSLVSGPPPDEAVVDVQVDGTAVPALRMEVVARLAAVRARHRRNWTRRWRITGVGIPPVLGLLSLSLRNLRSLWRLRPLLLRPLPRRMTILI